MGTLDNLKKMTGNDDVYQLSSSGTGAGNAGPEEKNTAAGGDGSPAAGKAGGANGPAETADAGGGNPNTRTDGGGKQPSPASAEDYESKAAAGAGRLEDWKPSTEPPKYEDIPEPPKRGLSMKEMYEKLNPGMSEEEIKKKERGMRIERLFKAIGDGISAIAALNATGKGALNTFFAKDSLTAGQNKRMEEWKRKVEGYRKGLYEAQMQDAENAEKDYKTRLEYVKAKNGAAGKLADFNLKLENLGRQAQKDAVNAYIALMQKKITQEQFDERMKELKRHNKVTEALGAGHLGVARQNAATNRKRFEHQKEKDEKDESTRYETYVNPKTGERTVLDTKAKDYYGQKRKLSQEYGDVYRDLLHDKKGRNTGESRINPNPSNERIDAVMAWHREDGPGGIDPKYLPKGKTTGKKLGVKW